MSLFALAEPVASRLKMLVYGPAGSGKTITALSFPDVAIIDTEKGTDHYGKYKKFYRIQTNDPIVVKSALDELINNPGNIKTIVIDSFSVLYDKIINNYESKQKIKLGKPDYVIQPNDYRFINSECRNIVDKLLALDMNIIVTCRIKPKYAEGQFMQVTGSRPDGPKDIEHWFDTVLELERGQDKFLAKIIKDRTNTLGKINEIFEYSYQTLAEKIGIEDLMREPVIINQQINLELNKGRTKVIEFKGNKIKTAGITAETLEEILALGIDEDKIMAKIQEDYSVDSLLDLKDDEAKLLLNELKGV